MSKLENLDHLNTLTNALEKLPENIKHRFLDKCEKAYNHFDNNGEYFIASIWKNAYDELSQSNSAEYFKMLMLNHRIPPTFEEFLVSDEYLNDSLYVWDAIKNQCSEDNPHIMLGKDYHKRLVINDSTLGTGKSYSLVLSALYKLCTLTCFKKPHLLFKNLDPQFPVFLYLISAKPAITKAQIYQPVRDIVDTCKYFQKYTNYNKQLESSLEFDNKIILKSAHSNNATSLLSLAVLWGVIDEANFFETVQNSKRADYGEREYNQVKKLFETLLQRYSSRFVTDVISYGGIEVVSSPLHEDDFVSWVHEQAKKGAFKDSYRYRSNKKWDVVPLNTYDREGYFWYVPHSQAEASKIYETKEEAPEHSYKIPKIYLTEFIINPIAAQRNHLGIRSKGISPFFVLQNKITECMDEKYFGITCKHNYVLGSQDGYPTIVKSRIVNNKLPRFIHVDLSYSGDRCGIAMCHVTGAKIGYDVNNKAVKLPTFKVDFSITIEPNESNQLDISKVREFIQHLQELGFRIKVVSYDQFQSQESITILNSRGIYCIKTSVDRTSDPYDNLLGIVNTARVEFTNNELLYEELSRLEKINLTQGKYKIDHPPNFSKDIADAVCGCIWNATNDDVSRFILANEFVSQMSEQLDIADYQEVDLNEYH